MTVVRIAEMVTMLETGELKRLPLSGVDFATSGSTCWQEEEHPTT